MAAYVVTVPAIQITVGARMFFLERGMSVPKDASDVDVERLLAGGYIEVLDEVDEPEGDDGTVDENPLEKMTNAELDELAKAEGIDLGGATKKADKVAVIIAAHEASATPVEPAPADPAGDPDESAQSGSDL